MKLHPLSPEVKCPMCGGVLVYVRLRRFGDLYQCFRIAKGCRGAVMHYRKGRTTRCGWAQPFDIGLPERWTECADQPAPKGK
jgi:hypothetical protein